MTSIGRSMSRAFTARLFGIFLLLDLAVISLAMFLFLFTLEKSTLGSDWTPFLNRSFSSAHGRTAEVLASLIYRFGLPGKAEHTVFIGTWMPAGLRLVQILGGLELLILIRYYFQTRGTVRKMLAPLDRMARTTEELSRAGFDPAKVHRLEDAISSFSPSTPGARLQIGDTELSGLETAINNLLSRMHESYREQIRFVSDASHELRTPISVIQGYADMLARWGSKDEKVLNEGIEAIRDESQRMQSLVEQLLFLARGDAGKTVFKPEHFDLSELVRESTREFSMINKEHSWSCRADSPVPVFADRDLLKQLIRILCNNAAKYSPPGEPITLSAAYDKGKPCFYVQDNGQGISDESLPHIFERFYRADPARSRDSGGTGLGLSIAKWIVDRHGAYFDILTREGIGTRMQVVLPSPPLEKSES